MNLTAERLREVLSYDPDTGIWTWRVQRARGFSEGERAGSLDTHGYRQIYVDGRLYLASRLAVLWMKGYWPLEQVDHENLVVDDDRWENLREATRSQNFGNQRVYASNKLGVKGVDFRHGRYRAQIQVNKRKEHLGFFETIEAASQAYKIAAIERFGEFHRVS